MNEINLYQVVSTVLLIISITFAGLAYRRAGTWRTSDAGKTMTDKVSRMESDYLRIDLRLAAAEQTCAQIKVLGEKVTRLETSLEHMAKRSDIEKLNGEIMGIERIGRNTEAAVQRIENFMMEASQR